MSTARQKFGRQGEQLAAQYLRRKGYIIIGQHYTSRWGEIDLIVQDKKELVFIEVKSRKTKRFGRPEESITKSKLNHLVKAICCYLEENDAYNRDYRIDVVLIVFAKDSPSSTIQHIKNVPPFEDIDLSPKRGEELNLTL